MKINQILILFLLFSFTNVVSIEPDEILKDAQLEQRARKISSVLRCMVCQNENIDNSNTGLQRFKNFDKGGTCSRQNKLSDNKFCTW